MPQDTSLRALPAPETNGYVPAVPEYIPIQPTYGYTQPESESPVVPLSHYLWILRRHKWRIASFIVACVASTIVVSSRLTPIYEATAAIDVDRQAPPAVVAPDAARMAPNDADQFLATQVKTIQSDSVLRPVVQRFKLLETSSAQTQLPTARVE